MSTPDSAEQAKRLRILGARLIETGVADQLSICHPVAVSYLVRFQAMRPPTGAKPENG